MEKIAAFVRRRGRVSIGALAKESNQLVDLKPNRRTQMTAARSAEDTAEMSQDVSEVTIVSSGLDRKR